MPDGLLTQVKSVPQRPRNLRMKMNSPLAAPVSYPLDYQITLARIIGIRVQELRAAGRVQEMLEMERALARLSEADFGACAGCGGLIALARLEAEPTTTRCDACDGGRATEEGEKLCSGTF